MNIKDMPHVTVEQVLALRAAAIELEEDLVTARQEATAYRVSLENLEASLPRIKADSVRETLSDLEHDCNGWAKDDMGRVYWHDEQIRAYANKLEAGE